MKILTVIGARPQFVKAAVVSQAFKEAKIDEVLINTGQHYDDNMSKVFFDEMGIPKPAYDLGVGSGTHARQTAASMVGIEEIILKESPDMLLVFGDTNATIAGAMAAAKLHVPIAHIEAGLRSYNRKMPEEINRIVTDVLSRYRFVPTDVARQNLLKEGISDGVYTVGDVMVDSLMTFTPMGEKRSTILVDQDIVKGSYILMTVHRPSNADSDEHLVSIMTEVGRSGLPILFPVHPRSRERVQRLAKSIKGDFKLIAPVGYLDMMVLEKNAAFIVTDSGGVQKEAYLHKTPCLTVRTETEWVETVEDGWNILIGDDHSRISTYLKDFPEPKNWAQHYGDGSAAQTISKILLKHNP